MSALAVEVTSFGDGVLHLLPGAAVAGATWQLCKLSVVLAGSDAHAGQALTHVSILDTRLLDYQNCACIHTTSYISSLFFNLIAQPLTGAGPNTSQPVTCRYWIQCLLLALQTKSALCYTLCLMASGINHLQSGPSGRELTLGCVLKSVIDGDWQVCASQVNGQTQKGCNSVVLCAGCHECQCFCHELPGYAA